MKTKLDERFVIAKDSQDKNEYIKIINEFINQHEGFRPEETSRWKKDALRYNFGRKFIQKYGCTLLDDTFFTKSKSLDTSNFYAKVCYSSVLKRNVIVVLHRYGQHENFILGEECNNEITLPFLRNLYKKVVVDIIDQANIMRQRKINRDIMNSALAKKYHFNPMKGKGEIYLKIVPPSSDGFVRIYFKKFGVINGKVSFSPYTDSAYQNLNEYIKHFGDRVHTDNFEELEPLMARTVQLQIDALSSKNANTLNQIKSFHSSNIF